jgi:hypothetical protein
LENPISVFLRLKQNDGLWLWRGENIPQGQMGGEEDDEPQATKPHEDIKVLIDQGLRLLVIETVKIIDV